MRILELRSENLKRLSVVQITPEGALVQITGGNGHGKTSVLDSIELALDAAGAETSVPIRKGKKSARSVVKLGTAEGVKLIIERRFTEKSSYLHVSTPEGARYPSPQKIVDALVGALSFDPLDFMRRDGKEQFKILRRIVKVPVDLDALDAQRAKLFEERTGTNREVKALQAQAESIIVPKDLPETGPDRAAILKRLAGVDEFNAGVRQIVMQHRALKAEHERSIDTVAARKRDMKALEERHMREYSELQARQKREHEEEIALELAAERTEVAARTAYDTIKNEDVPQLKNAAAITAELEAADAVLAGISKRSTRKALEDELAAEEAEAKKLTDAIDSIDYQKAQAIAETKMPIEGLSFFDGVVVFNGLPLNQASSAEQLRVSAAIGAALNPKLRVMLARDGSLLDSKSMALLAEFAEKNDFQIWLERISETGDVGVVIEDGHVKGQEELVLAFEKEEAAAAAQPTEATNGA